MERELAKENLSFSGLCEALEAADEEVEREVSQLLEGDEVFPYQTIGSAFAPLIVRENTLFDFGEGSYQLSE